jgi:hypothetical protein
MTKRKDLREFNSIGGGNAHAFGGGLWNLRKN